MDTSKIKDEQTRYFIEAIQAMYKGSYEDYKKIKENEKRNFLYAAIITGSIDQVENVLEGDEMDMCEGMERRGRDFKGKGKTKGGKRDFFGRGEENKKKKNKKFIKIVKLGREISHKRTGNR